MAKHGLRHNFNNFLDRVVRNYSLLRLDRPKYKLSDYNAHEIEPWICQPYQKGDYYI